MSTIQYSARRARLSLRLCKWAWPRVIMSNLISTNWNKIRKDKTQQLFAYVRPRPLRPSALLRGMSWTGVGRRRKFGECSCTECTGEVNEWLWIDSNGECHLVVYCSIMWCLWRQQQLQAVNTLCPFHCCTTIITITVLRFHMKRTCKAVSSGKDMTLERGSLLMDAELADCGGMTKFCSSRRCWE